MANLHEIIEELQGEVIRLKSKTDRQSVSIDIMKDEIAGLLSNVNKITKILDTNLDNVDMIIDALKTK